MGKKGKEICSQISCIWGANSTSLELNQFTVNFLPFHTCSGFSLPWTCHLYPALLIHVTAYVLSYSWDVFFPPPDFISVKFCYFSETVHQLPPIYSHYNLPFYFYFFNLISYFHPCIYAFLSAWMLLESYIFAFSILPHALRKWVIKLFSWQLKTQTWYSRGRQRLKVPDTQIHPTEPVKAGRMDETFLREKDEHLRTMKCVLKNILSG